MTPAAIMLTDARIPAPNIAVLAGLGDGLVEEDAGDGLVEDAGDGLAEGAGDGLVDDRHAQYKEDELPLSWSLLLAFTPPEGQLVPPLA